MFTSKEVEVKMDKKKVAILLPWLKMGGTNKIALNFIKELSEYCDVTLVLSEKSGELLEDLPENVHLLVDKMADYIMDNEEVLGLEVEEIEFICDAIKTHMGVWTTDYNGVEVLEKPKTKYQNFVHLCDFLASRKCILLPFDDNNEISVQ